MRFDSLSEVARYLAEKLADDTPLGWFREVGLRELKDGYELLYLTEPITANTYTTFTPGAGEIKVFVTPCNDRGTTCPASELLCDREDEVDCIERYLEERLTEAFETASRDPEARYWRF